MATDTFNAARWCADMLELGYRYSVYDNGNGWGLWRDTLERSRPRTEAETARFLELCEVEAEHRAEIIEYLKEHDRAAQ